MNVPHKETKRTTAKQTRPSTALDQPIRLRPVEPLSQSAYVHDAGMLDGCVTVHVTGPIAAEIRRYLAWIDNAIEQHDEGELDGEEMRGEIATAMRRLARLSLTVEDMEGRLRGYQAAERTDGAA